MIVRVRREEKELTITIVNEKEKEQLCELFPETIINDSDICIAALKGTEVYGILTAKRVLTECWDITFLHVDDAWRGHRVGEDMLKLLIMSVRNLGAGAVTASFLRDDDNDSLYRFALRKGFETVSESGVLSSTLSSVSISLEAVKKQKSSSGTIIPLSMATVNHWNALTRLLEERRSEQDKRRGNNSGFLYIMPEPKNYYTEKISFLALDKSGVPTGALLMREGENYISVDYLVSLVAKDPTIVINLMKASCEAMEERYKDIDIHFHTYNPAAKKLAHTLLGRYVKDTGLAVYMIKYL